jgi:hypothetical protein
MADRMSPVEIEDVLSSIRRLVAQDLRPRSPVVAPVVAPVVVPVVAPVADDKLLLTPALRVVPTEEPPVAGGETASAMMPGALDDGEAIDLASLPPPLFLHRPRVPSELAEAVSSIGAAVPDDGYESETGEMGPADALPVPDWPESSWSAPEVITAVDEAEVVDLTDGPAAWAQDGDLDLLGEDASADDDGAPYLAVEEEIDADGDAAEAAALAALADDEAGNWADNQAGAGSALAEIDEEMLRDIVRDIIREELQGALGERITRNVRKLVRSEINRAMVTRDFD